MNLDINVTSTCNLGCTYCSEGHNPNIPDKATLTNSKTDVKTEELIKFIDKLPLTESIKISFWGGEPMLNWKYRSDMITYYHNRENVDFFFYTNGIYIKEHLESIINLTSLVTPKRILFQISYDGKASNDLERLTKSGKSTTEVVIEGLHLLADNNIPVQMKSTISQKTFHCMYENFVDMLSLRQNYFPTPDSYSDYDFSTLLEDHQILKEQLLLIAKHIYINGYNMEVFGWFQNSKAICSAGVDYFAVDLNGDFSPCHGTLYDNSDDHKIGNINDENILDLLNDATINYKNLMIEQKELEDCKNCKVLFCMKCPAGAYTLPSTSYEASMKAISANNKSSLYDLKWTERNENMCAVFKTSDIIFKSLIKATGKIPNNTIGCKI